MLAYPVGFLTISISPIVLLAFLVSVCVTVLARGLFLPRRFPATACCGRCRYEISFDAPRCPECGSDLRLVGAITARSVFAIRSSFLLMILAWTVLSACLFGAAAAVHSVLAEAAERDAIDFRYSFSPHREYLRASRRGELTPSAPRYMMQVHGVVAGDDWEQCTLRIDPEDDGPRARVVIDAERRSWSLHGGASPITGSDLDADAVTQFFYAAGIATDSESLQLEIGQVVDLLDLLLIDGPDLANQQNWGLQQLAYTSSLFNQDDGLDLAVLSRGSMSSTGRTTSSKSTKTTTIEFSSSDPAIAVDVRAEFEFSRGHEMRPELLHGLLVLVEGASGWPLRIERDLTLNCWTASRNDESWAGGDMPISDEAIAELLERFGIEAALAAESGLASDIAAIVNTDNSKLATVVGWTPPVKTERPTMGLASHGGGWSTISGAPRAVFNDPLFIAITTGSLVVWIAGLWLIRHRRAKLLRLPDVSATAPTTT